MAPDVQSNPFQLSPVRRKRIEQAYDHAIKLMEKPEYDVEYVNKMLEQCVAGDPSNADHIDKFLANLYRKFKDKSKISKLVKLSAMSAHGTLKKALAAKDWANVARLAVELLEKNPWDSVPLMALGFLAEALGYEKTEIRCLKGALAGNRDDPDVNKQAARAAARLGEFEQAIACWHRVEKARPNDDEPPREIQKLTLRKAAAHSSFDDVVSKPSGGGGAAGQQAANSPEERLKEKITANPQDVAAYLELADFYQQNERFRELEAVLARAVQVSAGRADIKERLEDIQLTNMQTRVRQAELRARQSGSEEDLQQYKLTRKKLKLLELDVYKARSERYPSNLGFKHELAMRYQAVGDYQEAIKQFQQARNDPRRKGVCLLALGECFQQIKQPGLAMRHYEEAVGEIPDREADNKKLALYRAGWLAFKLKDWETAGKHLTVLAQLDYGYKDVAALLDKIEQLREDSGEPPAAEEPKPEES